MIGFMLRFYSRRIFLMNIIIFSLFMCVFNTDAAEAPAEMPDCLAGEAAKTYCVNLLSNLGRHNMTPENSVMLQVCCALLEFDYVWFAGIFVQEDIFVKIDINAILYTLSQKSSSNAEQLLHIFREEDDKVNRDEVMICHALGRCVPAFQPNDIKKIVYDFPQVLQQSDIVSSFISRYASADSKRFSTGLQHLLWQKDRILKPHDDICHTSAMNCDFVKYFAHQYRINCAFVKQWTYQCSKPMHGALEYPDSSVQSAVMYPGCAYQIQTAYLDRYWAPLSAYLWRGVKPNLDFNSPDDVGYAYAEEKVDIAEELPKMLDRIVLKMQQVPECESVACMENVHVRLDAIKKYISHMQPHQKAMIFVWAFVMERKGDRAFCDLGFLKEKKKNIHYLWTSCRQDFPSYIDDLTEYTNITDYGRCIRNPDTYRKHQEAKDCDSYESVWQKIIDVPFYEKRNPMGYLFSCIFSNNGDAKGAK